MRSCLVPGCSRPVSGYSKYCDPHKSRMRRHGDAEQNGVTKAELRPYVEAVRKRITKNADNAIWKKAELRWSKLTEFAKGELVGIRGGEAHIRWEREAYLELERLGQHVEPRALVETVLAMYMLAEHDPRRFRSDDAFWFQLVRRVRALTEVNRGTWQDRRTNRVKHVYRDSAPRATTYLAEMLVETFGVIGLTVARMERDQAKAQKRERRELHEALIKLK